MGSNATMKRVTDQEKPEVCTVENGTYSITLDSFTEAYEKRSDKSSSNVPDFSCLIRKKIQCIKPDELNGRIVGFTLHLQDGYTLTFSTRERSDRETGEMRSAFLKCWDQAIDSTSYNKKLWNAFRDLLYRYGWRV
ncbi:MAG: hypothetical protein JW768_03110 [Chitinispirillaceae bacterium]|nr:hypothetical protein [Chitinispirillaceae bacterium]